MDKKGNRSSPVIKGVLAEPKKGLYCLVQGHVIIVHFLCCHDKKWILDLCIRTFFVFFYFWKKFY